MYNTIVYSDPKIKYDDAESCLCTPQNIKVHKGHKSNNKNAWKHSIKPSIEKVYCSKYIQFIQYVRTAINKERATKVTAVLTIFEFS